MGRFLVLFLIVLASCASQPQSRKEQTRTYSNVKEMPCKVLATLTDDHLYAALKNCFDNLSGIYCGEPSRECHEKVYRACSEALDRTTTEIEARKEQCKPIKS